MVTDVIVAVINLGVGGRIGTVAALMCEIGEKPDQF
jgi:hypothetical protein